MAIFLVRHFGGRVNQSLRAACDEGGAKDRCETNPVVSGCVDYIPVVSAKTFPKRHICRILVLNNYSLKRVAREVLEEGKPAHHLFGVDQLSDHGLQMEIVPFLEGRTRWSGLLSRLLPPLGDLRQQWYAWKRRGTCDLIYAPCQTQTQFLSYLRALGLFRTPIVTLAHHPVVGGRLKHWREFFFRLQLRGTDAFPALSSKVAVQINSIASVRNLSVPLKWGPDLDAYPPPFVGPGSGVVSAGRTGRDFALLAQAAVRTRVPTQIFCLSRDWKDEYRGLQGDVKIVVAEKESDLGYRNLLPKLAAARVHAIPLLPGPSLSGLTSLTDALALGRPVVMTEHPLIDLDLEGEGVGRWVKPGDLDGWERALRWFDEHPEEAEGMGRRARMLAERSWNYRCFADQLATILRDVTAADAA